MRILQTLYFSAPYISGLTINCECLSREMIRRGHDVTVLASWHDRSLPREDVMADGVRVMRIPVAAQLSRAVILPTLVPATASLLRSQDILHLHSPMAEATPIAGLGRAMAKRVIVTHHSDLVLSSTTAERIATTVGRTSGIGAVHLANATVTSTYDQARVSPTVRGFADRIRIIPPPIPIPAAERLSHPPRSRHGAGDRICRTVYGREGARCPDARRADHPPSLLDAESLKLAMQPVWPRQ